jgi:hypothetical protein
MQRSLLVSLLGLLHNRSGSTEEVLLAAGHIVLEIPPGAYTLTERLWIKRSRLVLRGAGAGKTVFYIPKSELCANCALLRLGPSLLQMQFMLCSTAKSGGRAAVRGASKGQSGPDQHGPNPCAGLRDIYGPNPDNPRGAFVNTGAWPSVAVRLPSAWNTQGRIALDPGKRQPAGGRRRTLSYFAASRC